MAQREVEVITSDLLETMPLPRYDDGAAKHVRGKLLVVAGSAWMPGAAMLAARAALRVGCGTVRVAAPNSVALAIGVAMPELMMVPLPENSGRILARAALDVLEEQYAACDAAIVGPGLPPGDEAAFFSRQVIAHAPLPLVVDAQALHAWSHGSRGARGAYEAPPAPRIFTPHPGEMTVLGGMALEEIEANRVAYARDFARERRVTLVLKGAATLIADPDGPLYLNTAGTRGLGTAGSGDTLAGAIGGMLAQGMAPTRAAVWGVYLHALAGEAVAEDLGDDGILASEFVDRLPVVLRRLRRRISLTR